MVLGKQTLTVFGGLCTRHHHAYHRPLRRTLVLFGTTFSFSPKSITSPKILPTRDRP
jgi:hypothetical protein